jgi:23S rRNA maturation-related 3'-5' exoribonuclease YhaM
MKELYNKLLLSTEIKGIENLVSYLEKSNFYEAPASSGHHLSTVGGLLERSLNVWNVAKELPMSNEVDRNDLIISCLLHDVGKMGYFGQQMYLPNILASGKVSAAKPYETNKSIVLEHQDLSLMICNKFIDLNNEQAIAIKFHNGLYTKDGYTISGKETKLMMILHFADMWASRVVE